MMHKALLLLILFCTVRATMAQTPTEPIPFDNCSGYLCFDVPVVVHCNGVGQFCEPPFIQDLSMYARFLLRVAYNASPGHCSPVRVKLFFQPGLSVSPWTDFLERGERSACYSLGWNAPGDYTLEVYAEGKAEGCNSGRILSWGGSISICLMLAADLDADGDTDLDDYRPFPQIMSGPGIPSGAMPELDLDQDEDVDLNDYAWVQNGFTGSP